MHGTCQLVHFGTGRTGPALGVGQRGFIFVLMLRASDTITNKICHHFTVNFLPTAELYFKTL